MLGKRFGLAALAVAAGPGLVAAQRTSRLPSVELRPGLVITHSVRVVPRAYRLPAPASLDSAVITIRGDDLTVDFAGARLEGMDSHADPDQAVGVAVRVDGGHDVRILNAHIRGYKVGILARGTHGFTLTGSDLSYNWKPRLYSLVEHESLLDWLSFHHNEKDEWLRYGAGVYLADVSGGELRDNTAEQGMNGVMLVRSDHLRIHDNTLSYNSGLGLGLYRASHNRILHNRIDFDVRGYSEGFYRRGQDSAGLLLYEQSDSNVVAYNSVTHGGDGLFLWAGQSTMDSGLGGANDNLFFGNDFSFAPTNAMEATFSRNAFIANRAAGSDYGLWGGYSYESKVVGNCLLGNRNGIAIEHGQQNDVLNNRITGSTTGLWLWANYPEAADWGYPKHRDTHSRDYRVTGNTFAATRVALRVTNTAGFAATGNRFFGVDTTAVMKDTTAVVLAGNREAPTGGPPTPSTAACDPQSLLPAEYARLAPAAPSAERTVPSSALTRRDRSAIVVDQWGPYDWRSPRLWPVDSTHALPLRLAVLGPVGRWTWPPGAAWRRSRPPADAPATRSPSPPPPIPRATGRCRWSFAAPPPCRRAGTAAGPASRIGSRMDVSSRRWPGTPASSSGATAPTPGPGRTRSRLCCDRRRSSRGRSRASTTNGTARRSRRCPSSTGRWRPRPR